MGDRKLQTVTWPWSWQGVDGSHRPVVVFAHGGPVGTGAGQDEQRVMHIRTQALQQPRPSQTWMHPVPGASSVIRQGRGR